MCDCVCVCVCTHARAPHTQSKHTYANRTPHTGSGLINLWAYCKYLYGGGYEQAVRVECGTGVWSGVFSVDEKLVRGLTICAYVAIAHFKGDVCLSYYGSIHCAVRFVSYLILRYSICWAI